MIPVTNVAASDFRQNFGKYMALVDKQDFQITRNGRVVCLLTNPNRSRLELVEQLAGSIHAVIDEEADRAERLGSL